MASEILSVKDGRNTLVTPEVLPRAKKGRCVGSNSVVSYKWRGKTGVQAYSADR
jgi:hypothetical protein